MNIKKLILVFSNVAFVIVCIYFSQKFISVFNGEERDIPAINVSVETADYKEVDERVSAIGTVLSNREVTITSSVSKKVTNVLFLDGQFVKEGDLIVQLDDSQEQAERKSLEANFKEQEREFKRLTPLRKAGVVSEKDYETQKTKMQTAEANLDLINSKIKELKILAPFGGKLGLKNIHVGTLVTPGAEITTLDDIRQVKVDFYVPEKYISKLHVGDEIEAFSDSYKNISFKGKVLAISTRVDKDFRTLAVRGIFDNEKFYLRSGMSLRLDVVFNKRKSICVPEKSLVSDGNKKYIYLIENGCARKTEVITGKHKSGFTEITQGLKKDQQFIVDGIVKVKDGYKVAF